MSTDKINDGGPAFPNVPDGAGEAWADWDKGMTLRDYFAAKAMHAHLITDTVPGPACDALVDAAFKAGRDPIHHLALNSYEVADFMLLARAK